MSSHSHDNTVQHYYEGDQSKLYSGIMAHHGDVESAESKTQIKRIWSVFWILLVVTCAEVVVGMFFSQSMNPVLKALFFLVLTVFKAGYIVAVFMHLGDELKNFMITVLIPLVLFVWFIIAFLADGGFWLKMNNHTPSRVPVSMQSEAK